MVLGLLAGCDGPTRTVRVPVGPSPSQLAALDAAVALVDRTRADALRTADRVPDAARALDGADEAGATGQRPLATQARTTAREAVRQVGPALSALPQQVAAYRSALAGLQQAAAPLEADQREALAAAGAAGEREAAALGAFATSARELWPAYAALDEVQATWLRRVSAGWYRDAAEAAGAYVVLRRPVLPALEQARRALASADGARRPAIEQMRRSLSAADAALDRLRGPAG